MYKKNSLYKQKKIETIVKTPVTCEIQNLVSKIYNNNQPKCVSVFQINFTITKKINILYILITVQFLLQL